MAEPSPSQDQSIFQDNPEYQENPALKELQDHTAKLLAIEYKRFMEKAANQSESSNQETEE